MDIMDLFIKIEVKDNATETIKNTTRQAKDSTSAFKDFAHAIGEGLEAAAEIGMAALEKIGKVAEDIAKYSLDVGMSFEAQMSNVKSIGDMTEEEMAAITEKAKEMGVKTKYSATEAGEAMYYMAQAGWDASQIIGGIEGVMDLAAASGENLASVSDIVTDALTAFGLSAEDSGHFADVLAKAAAATNTDVAKLGQTFKYVAPIAGTLGYSIEDVAVAAGLMANSGIKASQAGTSLRSVLSRLASPTEQVKTAMEDLGISLTKSDGTSKSLADLMVDLRDAFSGLSESEQVAYASTLAAKTGMSGFLAIVNASDEDFEKLTSSINNASGAADKMATTMQDNLAGKVEILKSSMEAFGLAIFEKVTKPLQNLATAATGAIDKLTLAFDENGLSGLITTAGTLITNFGLQLTTDIPKKFSEMSETLVPAINTALDTIETTIEALAPSIAAAAETAANTIELNLPGLITDIKNEIEKEGPNIVAAGLGILTDLTNSLSTNIEGLWTTGTEIVAAILKGIDQNLDQYLTAAQNLITNLCSAMSSDENKENGEQIKSAAVSILGKLGDFLASNGVILLDGVLSVIKSIVEYFSDPENLKNLKDSAKAIASNLADWFESSETAQELQRLVDHLVSKIKTTVENIDWEAVGKKIVQGISAGFKASWEEFVTWVDGKMASLWQNVLDFVASVKSALSDAAADYSNKNAYFNALLDGNVKKENAEREAAIEAAREADKVSNSDVWADRSGTVNEGTKFDSGTTSPQLQHGTGTGSGVNIDTINIVNPEGTAADVMQSLSYEMERAALFGMA